MVQYHLTVNLDKREYLHPHRLGDGLKLLEQANSKGGIMVALHILLACSNNRGGGDFPGNDQLIGSWAGDRIAIIGDYAKAADLPEHNASNIYYLCLEEYLSEAPPEWKSVFYRDISDDVLPLVEAACDVVITGKGWRDKTCSHSQETTALHPDMIIVRN